MEFYRYRQSLPTTPVTKQVELITLRRKGLHTPWGTMDHLSKWMLKRLIKGSGLVLREYGED